VWRPSRRHESPVATVSLADVGDPAEQVTTVEAVRRVCARLPRRQRAAVVLRFFEDRDYAEVAALLGCSEATARSYVHRALQALRRELEEPGKEGSDA
jgi:RNA polymerase sigma factor (sigma-70 family)